MGFLCNHQELIYCHYIIFLLEILLCVLYMYLSLFLGEKTLEVGWKALVETLFEQNGWKWKGTYIALQSSLVDYLAQVI